MNKPSPINQTTLRIIYYRNKQFITPIIIFIVCIVVIFEAILPQVQDWFSIRNSVNNSIQKITKLNKDISVVSNINEDSLNSDIDFLSQVLPQSKDYIGVLNAISQAAILSATSLGDYSFDVGDLSKIQGKEDTIQIRLSISGGVAEAKKFISSLKNQAPLSTVEDIQIQNNIISILAIFYFKPFPSVTFDENTPVETLNQLENSQLQKLRGSIHTPATGPSLPSL